jgi:outer membrane protein assembly factor BamB
VAVLGAVNASACAPVIRHGPETQPVTWPVYLGSAAHDAGASVRMDAAPKAGWRSDAGREVRGAPAAGKGVIALGTTDKLVILMGTDSGQILWDRRVGGTVHGGPVLSGDRIYAATEESPSGRVYALEMRSGKVIWNAKTGGVAASLALAPDHLFAGTETGTVIALDPHSGDVQWRRELSGSIHAAPILTRAGLFVATTSDSLFLLNPANGDVRRRVSAPGAILATPASDSAHVYLATATGTVASVDPATLDTAWTLKVPAGVYGSPALVRDTLYVLTRTGQLVTVPLAAPRAMHAVDVGVVAVAGPTPLANGVLVADVAGTVHCVDPMTGAERWSVTVPGGGPVEQPPLVWDGLLIIVGNRGQVVTYK